MVLDKLGSGLQGVLEKVRGSGVVDKKTVKEVIKELQKTLISADVKIDLVFQISKNIEEKALKENLPSGISRQEHLIKVLYGEITQLMGGEGAKIKLDPAKENKIVLVGVQGSGKTTTTSKLARYYQKRGFKPGLICADIFRPGAYDQLQQLAQDLNIPFYGERDNKDSTKIAQHGVDQLSSKHKCNLLIIDSEGRHSLDKELMNEIERLFKTIKPDYTLLVLDSTIGQRAETQATAFKEKAEVNGIILTKLDGSAKGGGSISACTVAGAPVFFIGVGEKSDEFEEFNPDRFVGKLMGLGDVKGLLEKFQEHVDKDKAEDATKRMMAGKFTLVDVYEQLEQVSKMGSLGKLTEMLPFGTKVPKDMLHLQEDKLKKFKPILQSMTSEELENAKLSRARVERIAAGSGTKPEDVRALIQQYNQMRSTFKKVKKDRRFARMFKGMEIPEM
jgi:signal recognition particle subunit SRP54